MERDIENLVIPQHVALILDGNGRWATKRGLPRKAGHKAGAYSLRRAVLCAHALNRDPHRRMIWQLPI